MTADLERLLKLADRPGHMSVCHRGVDRVFSTAVVSTTKAVSTASEAADSGGGSDVWISVGRLAGPARKNKGRGTARDVRALTALQVDLDVKVGGMSSMEAAWAVVHELSTILGLEPAAVVMSGHGLQPWFVLDGTDLDWACDGPDDPRWAAIVVASRRWGRLVADVARSHGGAVDSVSDLSRLMRCPGTTNYKDRDKPVPVTVETWATQEPITFAHLVQVLDDYGVIEFPEDRVPAGEVIVALGEWAWAERSCSYSRAMTAGWASDSPPTVDGRPGARHPWLLAQCVRLAAAHRHGCLIEPDHAAAVSTLTERFTKVVEDRRLGEVRQVAPGEVSGALSWGVERVEAMSAQQVLQELGGHPHSSLVASTPMDVRASPIVVKDSVIVVGQSAVAQRVVGQFPGQFMFVPGLGWHAYDGSKWDQGNGAADLQVEQAVVAAARQLIHDAADEANSAKRDEMIKNGHRTLASSSQVAGVVDFVRLDPDVLIRADQLNADPMHFNVANGTLDLRTGILHPHDPFDRITRVAGTAYDPRAVGDRWPRFLAEALVDPALVDAVARCFGGAGLPGRVRDHTLPIIHGPGGTGKGTFIETLAAVFGDYAIAAEPELLLSSRSGSSHPTGSMDLLGVRLAFVNETDEGRRFDAATMKRLTGGDTIRARRMRQDFVQFRPSHLIAMVTNHLPAMPPGDDAAVWRRVRVIPFTQVPLRPDKRLGERLLEEEPGILTWLVDGLRDYERLGDDSAWPDSVELATAAYRERSDVLGSFVGQVTEEADKASAVSVGGLYALWQSWLELNAPDMRPGRIADFKQKLIDRGEDVAAGPNKKNRSIIRGRSLRDS